MKSKKRGGRLIKNPFSSASTVKKKDDVNNMIIPRLLPEKVVDSSFDSEQDLQEVKNRYRDKKLHSDKA